VHAVAVQQEPSSGEPSLLERFCLFCRFQRVMTAAGRNRSGSVRLIVSKQILSAERRTCGTKAQHHTLQHILRHLLQWKHMLQLQLGAGSLKQQHLL
jgi:hypothetical protein